jgi:hypothetical protein
VTNPTNDTFLVPVPPPGRDAARREPKRYTKGFRAMVGKRFGYKAARRAGKVWLAGWADETSDNLRKGGRSE